MSNYDLNTLNSEQLKALFQTEGPVLVNAGAGSGKTKLLTHRIVYLINEMNVSPYNILAITFTNKSANEMKERIVSMCPQGENVWISTFHSMCARILRQAITKLDGYSSNFTIYSDNDIDRVYKAIFEKFNIDDDKKKKKFISRVCYIKNYNLTADEFLKMFEFDDDSKDIVQVFFEYQNNLKQNNALDFDDLLIKTYELLTTDKESREYFQNKFKYVLVDEFQDTNKIQYELVKIIAGTKKNVFVVGDEDQSIYSWRGALHTNIMTFKKDYEGCQVFKLERNYRSTKNILNVANKVIENNPARMGKVLYTENFEGENVEFVENSDEKEEAYFVARKIHQLVRAGKNKYSDFAIIMRLNALSFPFEECLLSYNIPYRIFGGFKFFERVEIKNVVSYLRIFSNPKDEIALTRIINFPKRNIGQAAIEKLKDCAQLHKTSLLELIENTERFSVPTPLKNKVESFREIFSELKLLQDKLSLSEFVQNIIKKFAIKNAYSSDTEEDYNRCANIDTFISSVIDFEEKNEGATLAQFLENISLISDIDGMDSELNNVTVATIHSVKGLEFKIVFVIGCEEKIFPISRAFDNPSDMQEERRLMYVAITRAEHKLFLTSSKTRFMYGKRDYMTNSRFLNEAGLIVKRDRQFLSNSSSTSSVNSFYSTQSLSENLSTKNVGKSQYSYSPQKFNNSEKTAYGSFLEEKKEKTDTTKYCVGNSVLHPKFGVGKILSFSSDRKCADIDFKGLGTKTLLIEIAPLKILGGENID